jgi:chorismate mutase/prephenate dehydratase
MPDVRLRQIWPDPSLPMPEAITLDALRHEIDTLDREMLALFERRLALAERVGRAKDAPHGPHSKLRPDREAAVLSRLTACAKPQNRNAVEALWREVVGWGLARQGELQVRVWAPSEPARAYDGARARFGRAAQLKMARTPEDALDFAAEGHGVAVLGIDNDSSWWIGLRREYAALSVFDGFGGDQPTALAVGQIDPVSLPGRRSVVVSAGGDAGDGAGARRWGLHTHHGWSLSMTEVRLAPGGPEGCVGAVG